MTSHHTSHTKTGLAGCGLWLGVGVAHGVAAAWLLALAYLWLVGCGPKTTIHYTKGTGLAASYITYVYISIA
jgi:hypothetical protein